MRRPVIGIAGVSSDTPSSSPFHAWQRIFTSQAYTTSVARSGGVPVMLPPTDDEEVIRRELSVVDGLLLQGGNDIDPSLYGEEKDPLCGETDLQQDRMLIALFHQARTMGKPILGICKGIQLVNVALGGTLYQDVSRFSPNSLQHDHLKDATKPFHQVKVEQDSLLWEIFHQETLSVNSLHHQIVKDIAPSLTIAARATDGAVEAVQGNEGPFLLAVQWHPEAMMMASNDMLVLFSAFINACRI
jgi:putative glutamine amidotransferase